MKLLINEQSYEFTTPLTLQALLIQLDKQQPGYALAVNQQIIPRDHWEHTPLNDGDNILLFQAIAGG
jgi:sulfur carrier protein